MLCTYADGEIILQEGVLADRLIVILQGKVEIMRDGVFSFLRTANEIIGEQGVVDNVTFSATAIAWGTVQVLAIPGRAGEKIFKALSLHP
jgi:CRP-like cAMP-binding protein